MTSASVFSNLGFYDSGRVFYHCFQALRTSCVGTHGKEQGHGGICPGSLVFLRMRLPELPLLTAAKLSVKVEISSLRGREGGGICDDGRGLRGDEGREPLKRVFSHFFMTLPRTRLSSKRMY